MGLAAPLTAQAAEQGSGEAASNALSWHVVGGRKNYLPAPAYRGAYAATKVPAQVRVRSRLMDPPQRDFQLEGR